MFCILVIATQAYIAHEDLVFKILGCAPICFTHTTSTDREYNVHFSFD